MLTKIYWETQSTYGNNSLSSKSRWWWWWWWWFDINTKGYKVLHDRERSGRPRFLLTDIISCIVAIVKAEGHVHITIFPWSSTYHIGMLTSSFAGPLGTEGFMSEKLWVFHLEILHHPPYSPDFNPSDFHISRPMKKFLAKQRFTSNNEAKAAVRQ